MHERRFSGEIARLRAPERIARMEVDRVVELSLEGIHAGSVLDVGTGSGVFAEAFAGLGFSVTGIDPNPAMIAAARKYIPAGKFRIAAVEKMPFKDKAFDLVFMGTVLHESDDLRKALAESKRCARRRVAILEWPYREEEAGPPIGHRLRPETVLESARAAGFSGIETCGLAQMVFFRFTL